MGRLSLSAALILLCIVEKTVLPKCSVIRQDILPRHWFAKRQDSLTTYYRFWATPCHYSSQNFKQMSGCYPWWGVRTSCSWIRYYIILAYEVWDHKAVMKATTKSTHFCNETLKFVYLKCGFNMPFLLIHGQFDDFHGELADMHLDHPQYCIEWQTCSRRPEAHDYYQKKEISW